MTGDGQANDRASEVSPRRSLFDRFAEWGAQQASRGPFSAVCLAWLAGWLAVAGPLMGYSDRWIELGAFCMAAITFLMLALLQNSERRSDQAVQRKLNALVEATSLLLERQGAGGEEVDELRAAIGLEHRESTKHSP